jgi:2-polyprenyl-3-methyl-5-hydroxy-6-metoxy-1,4-benzoquinol methylase
MIASFNAKAKTWDEDPRKVAVAGAIAKAMLGSLTLTPQTTLLDYGAGTGLVSLALAPHVGMLIAADESEGMLDVLRSKLAATGVANVLPWQWNVDLATPDDLPVIDVITGSMVLHHVKDVPAAAAVFHAMLRPGGAVAFADLDLDDGEFHGADMHAHHPGFDRNWLRKVFERAGFGSVAFSEAHQVAKKTDSGQERTFTIFLMTAIRS